MMTVDFLIIGAGLSGIGMAAHLKTTYPTKSIMILEKRNSIGGTWDVFKYPGVRSDSDMFTLSYDFKPWYGNFFANGSDINQYIIDTAHEYDLVNDIRFDSNVTKMEWDDDKWTVYADEIYSARFVICASGYINHEKAHIPLFNGVDGYEGMVVHSQFWPSDLEYAGKNIIVIGSGATAFTLVPEIAKCAKNVTVIQRSPSYIRSEKFEPDWVTHLEDRTTATSISANNQEEYLMICRERPVSMRRVLLGELRKKLNPNIDMKHFTPEYMPWDQRVCTIVDDDFINVVNNGKVEMVTDTVDHFTSTGIVTTSGTGIDADIVVLCTGFETRMMGDIVFEVDSRAMSSNLQKVYKGTMLENIPNFGFIFGYSSLSWTLKLNLLMKYYDSIFKYMDEHNYSVCVPVDSNNTTGRSGFIDLRTNFYLRNEGMFPRQGDAHPWINSNSYKADTVSLTEEPVNDGVIQWR